jgi:hypothetical protein
VCVYERERERERERARERKRERERERERQTDRDRDFCKSSYKSQVWRFTPVILATWEAEIEKTAVPGQPGQKETLTQKKFKQKGLEPWFKWESTSYKWDTKFKPS